VQPSNTAPRCFCCYLQEIISGRSLSSAEILERPRSDNPKNSGKTAKERQIAGPLVLRDMCHARQYSMSIRIYQAITAIIAFNANGLIAFEGRRLGGDVFASFDRKAIRLIAGTGAATHLLSDA
jgi:hypothetical protein